MLADRGERERRGGEESTHVRPGTVVTSVQLQTVLLMCLYTVTLEFCLWSEALLYGRSV